MRSRGGAFTRPGAAPDPSLRSTGRDLWWVFVVGLVASLYSWWPMIQAYPATQNGDGQVFQKMFETAVVSVVRFHEFPFWNPYECGGLPLWDNPQAPIGSPLALGMFFFDTTIAMAVWYVIHSALGVVCMWRFAREGLALSRGASLAASVAWSFSGFHVHHYAGGHLAFGSFLFFPLAWLLWRTSWRSKRDAVYLGMLVALMMYEGGVYPLPHLVLLLALATATGLIAERHSLRDLAFWRGLFAAALIVAVVGVGLAAARLLPVMDQLAAHKRNLGTEADYLRWPTIREMFLAREHPRHVPGQEYVWTEYASYIGLPLFALALLGLAAGALAYWELSLALVVFAALMAGHFSPNAPWHVIKEHVFPFKEMRVPSRFRVEVLLALASFVGIAIDRLGALSLRRRSRGLGTLRPMLLVLACIGLGDLLSASIAHVSAMFTTRALERQEASERLYLGGPGLAADLRDQPRQNRGRFECYEEWGWGRSAPLWSGDVPQARAEADGVRVSNVVRTPNTFRFDVEAPSGGTVQLNTAYDRQWQTSVGKIRDRATALDVDVPRGTHQVVVRYRPRTFSAGAALTVSTALALVLAAWIDRARRAGRGSTAR
jgi:hypothetical protein